MTIKNSLVALPTPRALEVLEATLRRIEAGRDRWHRRARSHLIEELTGPGESGGAHFGAG
jgi:hypothetical protein